MLRASCPNLPPFPHHPSEYLDGLAADESAAAAQALESASAAALEAATAEASAAAADAAELEHAVAMSIELDREGAIGAARARLAANPEPQGASVSIVRVALPSGGRVQRGFAPDATLSLVADFALCASAELGAPLPVGGFDLRTAMPRVVYDCHSKGSLDAKKSLTELGLARGASVMVSLV